MAKELTALQLARLRGQAAIAAATQTTGTANTLANNLQGLMGALAGGGLIMDTSAKPGFQNINFARGTKAAKRQLTGVANLYTKGAKTEQFYANRPWIKNILDKEKEYYLSGYAPTPTPTVPNAGQIIR